MGLKCNPGFYSEVIKKLVFGLNIDQKNMYLLFGPVDILMQFPDLKDTKEFIEKWFNPIRLIGEENLIAKTISLIVISEGPKLTEPPCAFVFLNTEPKSLETARMQLLKIPEILSADSVFGPYDIICSVKASDIQEVETIIQLVQQIPGIESSTTSIVSPIKLMPDW